VTTTINAVRRVKSRREEQLGFEAEGDEAGEGQARLLADDPQKAPDRMAEQSEVMQKVKEALHRLPENRRLAVGLYLEGMTTEEIGNLMEWTEAKARNLAYRGLNDLRRELRSMGIDYP
jgi:RNA polymerase sigma factor (sigma-70 family)